MASEERIVRYAWGEVPEAGRTDWERVRAMTDEEVEAAAHSDPDNPPATDEDLEEAVLVSPFEREALMVIRLDREVVDHYRRQGPGFKKRINDDLLALVRGRARGEP